MEADKEIREDGPVRDDFLVFGTPLISDDEVEEVVATLRSGWIGTGPRVHKFQEEFRKYTSARHAVALGSCTAALHLSLLAAGVGAGDEVITTPMTFCATANAIIHSGATPVFADCGRYDFNIDPEQIRRRITPRTKALVVVHFAGRPCDMVSISAIAREHGLVVIEDCAHAIETMIGDRHAGTFGDFGCFSFYVTKNVVTGEGGMVLTAREDAADMIRVLGLHGMSKDAWSRFSDEGYRHYKVITPGFKYNMMDIQAALGLRQLEKVEKNWLYRKRLWGIYNEAFRELPCFTPAPEQDGTRHAYHLYTLLLDTDRLDCSRDDVLDLLTKEKIGVGVHYLALHTHPYYADTYGLKYGDYPNAEFISERTVSLPLSPKVTEDDARSVISAVRKILTRHKR